jgi:hypothetical protein
MLTPFGVRWCPHSRFFSKGPSLSSIRLGSSVSGPAGNLWVQWPLVVQLNVCRCRCVYHSSSVGGWDGWCNWQYCARDARPQDFDVTLFLVYCAWHGEEVSTTIKMLMAKGQAYQQAILFENRNRAVDVSINQSPSGRSAASAIVRKTFDARMHLLHSISVTPWLLV